MNRITEWFHFRRDKIGWDGIVIIVVIFVVLVLTAKVCTSGGVSS